MWELIVILQRQQHFLVLILYNSDITTKLTVWGLNYFKVHILSALLLNPSQIRYEQQAGQEAAAKAIQVWA